MAEWSYENWKHVNHGEVVGYVVMTWTVGLGWRDDWDGVVHPTFEQGQAAVREATEDGHTCLLTECRYVPSNPPPTAASMGDAE